MPVLCDEPDAGSRREDRVQRHVQPAQCRTDGDGGEDGSPEMPLVDAEAREV